MTNYRPNFSRLIFFIILTVVAGLVACAPAPAPENGVSVQAALPTSTLEPTFTPSPAPIDTPTPTPTDTPPPEPTSTLVPRAGLSGRILDQETNQPITEAQVSVGDLTTTTNAKGRYTLTGLAPGQYVLSVTHPDYDPGLSSIFTLVDRQDRFLDLTLFAPETSPYPQDPMLTNPLDPSGAPTEKDAIRLAQEQGLTGEVVNIEEATLTGEYLVNYKIGDEIRAAVAKINHDVWELTDETGRKWWIIKVCGNLASPLPARAPIPTPAPRPLPPLAEVMVDGLVVRTCASEECAEVGTVQRGERVEVFGCLAEGGDWCEVGWPSQRGWCTGQSLRQLAVATAIPEAAPVLPTPTPTPAVVVASGERKIAFVSERDGDQATYAMNPDGSEQTRLSDSGGALSPDGQKIVFVSDRDGNDEIYVMNTDGSGLKRLTNELGWDGNATWSPNGQQILFVTRRHDPDPENCGLNVLKTPRCNGEIYVTNADGSGLKRLTNDPGDDEQASWSPDGRRIVFSSLRADSGLGIYVMNADGSGQTRLTDGSFPDWLPAGTRIAFVARHDIGAGIYTINVDGSGLTRLTDQPAEYKTPAWSPDGRQIAFLSDRDYGGNFLDVYIMNADGSGLKRLTSDHSTFNNPIAWSPDGQKIVFTSYCDGNLEIYIMNADGSGQNRLTNHSAHDFAPVWSR